jgi:hypothetical protein
MPRVVNKTRFYFRCAVLGDGQTEQYYLQYLKNIRCYTYIVRPRLFRNITIETSGKLIKELLEQGYDLVIYLTDYDTVVAQGKIDKFNNITAKYRKNYRVKICESMPSIEFWFLLHYIKTTRNFQNAGEVLTELKKHLPEFSKETGFLEKQKWVEELCANGKLATALKNSSEILAEKEEGNAGEYFPYTKVGEGIGWLEKSKRTE